MPWAERPKSKTPPSHLLVTPDTLIVDNPLHLPGYAAEETYAIERLVARHALYGSLLNQIGENMVGTLGQLSSDPLLLQLKQVPEEEARRVLSDPNLHYYLHILPQKERYILYQQTPGVGKTYYLRTDITAAIHNPPSDTKDNLYAALTTYWEIFQRYHKTGDLIQLHQLYESLSATLPPLEMALIEFPPPQRQQMLEDFRTITTWFFGLSRKNNLPEMTVALRIYENIRERSGSGLAGLSTGQLEIRRLRETTPDTQSRNFIDEVIEIAKGLTQNRRTTAELAKVTTDTIEKVIPYTALVGPTVIDSEQLAKWRMSPEDITKICARAKTDNREATTLRYILLANFIFLLRNGKIGHPTKDGITDTVGLKRLLYEFATIGNKHYLTPEDVDFAVELGTGATTPPIPPLQPNP